MATARTMAVRNGGVLNATGRRAYELEVEKVQQQSPLHPSASRPCGAGCAWQSTFCQSPEVLRLKGDQSSQIRASHGFCLQGELQGPHAGQVQNSAERYRVGRFGMSIEFCHR